MRSWRWYSKVLLALLVAAFAYWVWPTPYQYLPPPLPKGMDTEYDDWGRETDSGIVALRFNRFTGMIQALSRDGPGYWYAYAMPPTVRLSPEAENEVRVLHLEHANWNGRDLLRWQTTYHPYWDFTAVYYAWRTGWSTRGRNSWP